MQLKLTNEDNFWLSVEMSAATGLPVPADVHYLHHMQSSANRPEPLLDSMQACHHCNCLQHLSDIWFLSGTCLYSQCKLESS